MKRWKSPSVGIRDLRKPFHRWHTHKLFIVNTFRCVNYIYYNFFPPYNFVCIFVAHAFQTRHNERVYERLSLRDPLESSLIPLPDWREKCVDKKKKIFLKCWNLSNHPCCKANNVKLAIYIYIFKSVKSIQPSQKYDRSIALNFLTQVQLKR